MKRTLTFLSLILTMQTVSAQTEKPGYKAAADAFVKGYNAGDYTAVFNLFATVMKNALPMDKTQAFLADIKSRWGKINKYEFATYTNGSYGTYKTTFDNALIGMSISVDDDGKINGLFVKAYEDESLPQLKRNTTKMALPFNGEWSVFWGGDTEQLNYHVTTPAQKGAFDMVVRDAAGKTFRTTGATNDDYYAFGKPIIAPCDAEVVQAVDGIKDNKPGVMNPTYLLGNSVIMKTAKGEYLVFAHFKQGSVMVKQGQQIKQGQQLGLCGNTGNSSECHLHFHIMNAEDMTVATGAKCYFDHIIVNGQSKSDYSPVKGEKVKNP